MLKSSFRIFTPLLGATGVPSQSEICQFEAGPHLRILKRTSGPGNCVSPAKRRVAANIEGRANRCGELLK